MGIKDIFKRAEKRENGGGYQEGDREIKNRGMREKRIEKIGQVLDGAAVLSEQLSSDKQVSVSAERIANFQEAIKAIEGQAGMVVGKENDKLDRGILELSIRVDRFSSELSRELKKQQEGKDKEGLKSSGEKAQQETEGESETLEDRLKKAEKENTELRKEIAEVRAEIEALKGARRETEEAFESPEGEGEK